MQERVSKQHIRNFKLDIRVNFTICSETKRKLSVVKIIVTWPSDFMSYSLIGLVAIDVVNLIKLERQNNLLLGRTSITSAVTDNVL